MGSFFLSSTLGVKINLGFEFGTSTNSVEALVANGLIKEVISYSFSLLKDPFLGDLSSLLVGKLDYYRDPGVKT